MTACVSFAVDGTTVQVHLPPGASVADVNCRHLAALVRATRAPRAECPVCYRTIGLTYTGRHFANHHDTARNRCPMSGKEVLA